MAYQTANNKCYLLQSTFLFTKHIKNTYTTHMTRHLKNTHYTPTEVSVLFSAYNYPRFSALERATCSIS